MCRVVRVVYGGAVGALVGSTGVFGLVYDALSRIVSLVCEGLSAIITTVRAAAAALLGSLSQGFHKLIGATSAVLFFVPRTLSDAVGSIFSGTTGIVETTFSGVKTVLWGAWNALIFLFAGLFVGIGALVSGVGSVWSYVTSGLFKVDEFEEEGTQESKEQDDVVEVQEAGTFGSDIGSKYKTSVRRRTRRSKLAAEAAARESSETLGTETDTSADYSLGALWLPWFQKILGRKEEHENIQSEASDEDVDYSFGALWLPWLYRFEETSEARDSWSFSETAVDIEDESDNILLWLVSGMGTLFKFLPFPVYGILFCTNLCIIYQDSVTSLFQRIVLSSSNCSKNGHLEETQSMLVQERVCFCNVSDSLVHRMIQGEV